MRRIFLAIAACLWASGEFSSNHAFGQAGQQTAGPSTGTGYPSAATPVTATVTGANTTTQNVTIPALPGRLSFICGFTVSGNGATAAAGTAVTVGPTIGSFPQQGAQAPVTLNYTYGFVTGATLANNPLNVAYWPCLPASLPNTAITVTVTGAAGNTTTNVDAQGYQLPAN